MPIPNNVDGSIGSQYTDLVCENCKGRLLREGQKLNKLALLNPMGVSRKFAALVCDDCRKKIIRRMRKRAQQ